MTELTREQIEYWRECILARDWREGARTEINALCNLALSALEGEEYWFGVDSFGDVSPETHWRAKLYIERPLLHPSSEYEGWTVRRFRLVPVEG